MYPEMLGLTFLNGPSGLLCFNGCYDNWQQVIQCVLFVVDSMYITIFNISPLRIVCQMKQCHSDS